MKILVTGSTGLVGGTLIPTLRDAGHTVGSLLRSGNSTPPDGLWNPTAGTMDPETLEGCDAVIHLAGESIAAGRWAQARKQEILDSRVKGTRLLAESFGKLQRPPKVFVSASAVGYYGDRGAEILTEDSSPGSGFL